MRQILYWHSHLGAFIIDYLGIILKDTQRVVARQFGNAEILMVVKSCRYGKTWLVPICCLAIEVLYPGTYLQIDLVAVELREHEKEETHE